MQPTVSAESAKYGPPAGRGVSGLREARWAAAPLAVALCCAAALAAPLTICAAVAPKFMEIFRDFGVRLSVISKFFLDLGTVVGSAVGVVAVAAIAAALGAGAYALSRVRPAAGVVVLCLCIVTSVLFMLLFVLTTFLPLSGMVRSLQAGSGAGA